MAQPVNYSYLTHPPASGLNTLATAVQAAAGGIQRRRAREAASQQQQNALNKAQEEARVKRQLQFSRDMAETLGRAQTPEQFEGAKRALLAKSTYLTPEERQRAQEKIGGMEYSPDIINAFGGGGKQKWTAPHEGVNPETSQPGYFQTDSSGKVRWLPARPYGKDASGFTLSPGQVRYDANGKMIADVKPSVSGKPGGGKLTLSDLKVQAWNRVNRNEATQQDLALLGLDKDPLLAQAAQMVMTDPRSIAMSSQDRTDTINNLADELRKANTYGSRFMKKGPAPAPQAVTEGAPVPGAYMAKDKNTGEIVWLLEKDGKTYRVK